MTQYKSHKDDKFFKYYILLCIVIVVVSAFTSITVSRTMCVNKFDTIAEIEKCMRLVN